eukprot:2173248-Pyramimonas_sp.AAC.1
MEGGSFSRSCSHHTAARTYMKGGSTWRPPKSLDPSSEYILEGKVNFRQPLPVSTPSRPRSASAAFHRPFTAFHPGRDFK